MGGCPPEEGCATEGRGGLGGTTGVGLPAPRPGVTLLTGGKGLGFGFGVGKLLMSGEKGREQGKANCLGEADNDKT